MIISRLFVEYILVSFFGWVYESIYCTVRAGHWQSRGFLFGPVCPIYGAAYLVVRLLSLFPLSSRSPSLAEVFFSVMILTALLEYTTSWLMEKIFCARWWDYSDMPLNLNGRICLPATLLFGLAGVLFWQFVLPHLPGPQRMEPSLLMEGLSLVIMGIFAGDFLISFEVAHNLIGKLEAAEDQFNQAAESGVLKIRALPGQVKGAGSKVRGITLSIGPRVVRMIDNPSVQLREFALKLSEREKRMLFRIRKYRKVSEAEPKKEAEGDMEGPI